MWVTCPPWTDTYKKIFNDDCSTNYIYILKNLKDRIPDFDNRISVRFTEKPLFNDTYIVDNHLITSPYVHNRNFESDKHEIITADKFFSIETSDNSHLFNFFEEDFMSVWESEETSSLNYDFELFDSKMIEEKLVDAQGK